MQDVVTVSATDAGDAESLLKNAEAALNRAKTTGDRYLFYTQQMTERVAAHLTLENKLRHALERNEFVLHYQPKVDVETRRILGVEALLRWQSPDLGLVLPGQFITIAEDSGLIEPIGEWVLRTACTQMLPGTSSPGLLRPPCHVNLLSFLETRLLYAPVHL